MHAIDKARPGSVSKRNCQISKGKRFEDFYYYITTKKSTEMANLDLTKYGIVDTVEILHNPSYEVLFAEETKASLEGYEKGQVTELGAVNVMTGIYTGRSPKDKFFVIRCK